MAIQPRLYAKENRLGRFSRDESVDIPFLLLLLTLLAVGLTMLYSASAAQSAYDTRYATTTRYLQKQLVCGVIGLAAMAFALDIPLILVLVGFVYIVETVSDLIQIGYFKATHGKRFFKMAPIHHHFEMCGWSEEKIFTVFVGITCLMCVAAWFGVQGRYAP